MDKNLIRTRFSRSIRSYDEYAIAQRLIAVRLCDMLAGLSGFQNGTGIGPTLEIGCGTGTFTRMMLEKFHPSRLTLVDICPEVRETLQDILASDTVRFIAGDAEHCPLPAGQSLIASCSVMQWFEDTAGFLSRCRTLLSDDGILALTTFGPDNLLEIASVTGVSLSYLPLEWLRGALMEAGFEILVAKEEHIVLNFTSPTEVLRHLKSTGVTGITRTAWTRSRLAEFSTLYHTRFGTLSESTVPLTYHPIYLIARPVRER